MARYLMSCGECGLLLQDMQHVQDHASEFSHSNISLSLDGSIKFGCCQCCDRFFRYEIEMIEHNDKMSHNSFVKEDMSETELGQSSYITPPKQRTDSGSVMRTVKKAPKLKEFKSSAILFTLSDEESETVFGNKRTARIDVAVGTRYYGTLFKVRSLNSIQLEVDDIDFLRKKYVIAEGVDRTVAKFKIKGALADWEADNQRFKLIGTNRRYAYVFEEKLQQVCLTRCLPNECAADKSQRMHNLLTILLGALEDDIVLRIRSLYYLYPSLHVPGLLTSKQQIAGISDTVGDICLLLEVTRESLNLFASPKGLISGPLLLFSDGELWADCSLGGPSGCLIPSESVFINSIRETASIDFVLVLEKETIFHYLRDHNFGQRHNCVLVTGKGHADLSTRILLRKMRDQLKGIPFYCLVDANPSGAQIFCTFRFGSEEKAYDSLCLTVPDLDYIGVNLKDVPEQSRTPLAGRDVSMLDKMLEKTHISSVEILRTNLAAMKSTALKADIEAIVAEVNLEEYILEQMDNADQLSNKVRPKRGAQTLSPGDISKKPRLSVSP